MFSKNVLALCVLTLFALVLSVSANNDVNVKAELEKAIEEFTLLEEFIEYIKDNYKIAKECADDALQYCKALYPNKPFKLPKCILEYILQRKGLCNITNE